jgi:hypothetical protein
LMLDRLVEKQQPTKAAMKKQLAEVRDAALLLRCALSDKPTREFLALLLSAGSKTPLRLTIAFKDLFELLGGDAAGCEVGSISPFANRSFKISMAREAVSCTSASSPPRVRRPPQHIRMI